MDEDDQILPPFEAFVDSLLGWSAVTKQILDRMECVQRRMGPLAPPIPETFAGMLLGTLGPMAESRDFELGVAARVVEDALEAVAEAVALVLPPRP